jgi:hypothetical protein
MEKAFHTGMYEGTGNTVVRSYNKLHERTKQLLPDDYFINEVLVLEVTDASDDEQKIGQVRLVCDQLIEYLENLIKQSGKNHRERSERRAKIVMGDMIIDDSVLGQEGETWGDLARDLNDQILRVTKQAIRRAMENIDFGIDSIPPIPPVPPVPPVPPMPPHQPGRPPRPSEENDAEPLI